MVDIWTSVLFPGVTKILTLRIWNEHMSVSSTDIIAPALSNSPQ